ncbi:hypothetical protein Cgig2_017253 [Carnegiea gigantea]|uniref:Reverse transcriptase zinc-binding domain-containing protein n=1 Tax=Carnegiea gigantea TaxID=171969 RepID=A0A9Q1GY24_9CARY|nr:hypothetical protein Cgig2_017253 [Carnegiea gigantea]
MEARNHYIRILSSSIDLIKQQSKAEWMGYGDDCTRFFFTRAKQRKLAAYVYSLEDAQGHTQYGFSAVAQIDEYCPACPTETEDQDHVFFRCGWAWVFWTSLLQWWPIPFPTQDLTSFNRALKRLPGPRAERRISYTVITAAIYQIWRAENSRIFEHRELPVHTVVAQTKGQIIQRICFLNTKTGKYTACMDKLYG